MRRRVALDHRRKAFRDGADDPFVLRNRPLREGITAQMLSRFSDDLWHINAAQPDLHQNIPALHWKPYPPALVTMFKSFMLCALDHPYPNGPGFQRSGNRPSAGTLRYWILDLRLLAWWMNDRGLTRLSDLTDADLDAYRIHVLALECSPGRKADMLAMVRTVWLYRELLPDDAKIGTGYPWGTETAAHLVKLPVAGPDNKTPRIAADTMEALLAWSLRMVEDIGPDIIAAREELQQLEAGTHPSLAKYAGLPTRQRLALYLDEARRNGLTLPRSKVRPGHANDSHIRRLIGIPENLRGGFTRAQRRSVEQSGLPLATGSPIGTITGRINGAPWRTAPIDISEIHTLVRLLSAACFTVISYLSGMRLGEVLNLRRGCRATDEDTGELLVVGMPGKGYDRMSKLESDSLAAQRPWTVVQPVHDAIAVLERLHEFDLLFPAALNYATKTRPHNTFARRDSSITRDLDSFVTWVNDNFTQPDGKPAIPPDPTKHLHASRFRRTLAYFIVRKPRGLIAAALQYGHASTKVTLSYAGRADTSWLDDLAIERLELILEQNDDDHRHISGSEHISGTAAGEYRRRVAAAAQFGGRVITSRRSVQRLLTQADVQIHHGEAMTCVWQAATAACRAIKLEQGLMVVDEPDESECRSSCTNLAYTDRDISQLRDQHQALSIQAADELIPLPLRDRYAELAARSLFLIERHDATTPGSRP